MSKNKTKNLKDLEVLIPRPTTTNTTISVIHPVEIKAGAKNG